MRTRWFDSFPESWGDNSSCVDCKATNWPDGDDVLWGKRWKRGVLAAPVQVSVEWGVRSHLGFPVLLLIHAAVWRMSRAVSQGTGLQSLQLSLLQEDWKHSRLMSVSRESRGTNNMHYSSALQCDIRNCRCSTRCTLLLVCVSITPRISSLMPWAERV